MQLVFNLKLILVFKLEAFESGEKVEKSTGNRVQRFYLN